MFLIVPHFETPRAKDASRRSFGTDLSASEALMNINGIIIIANVIPPVSIDVPKPIIRMRNMKPNAPKIMDGVLDKVVNA